MLESDDLRNRIPSEDTKPDLAQGDDPIDVMYSWNRGKEERGEGIASFTWDEIFYDLAGPMLTGAKFIHIMLGIGRRIAALDYAGEMVLPEVPEGKSASARKQCQVSEDTARAILSQFAALGLVEPDVRTITESSISGGLRSRHDEYWRLTSRGREKHFAYVAARRVVDSTGAPALADDGEE